MKKFIKKIELKPLLISVGLVIFQSIFFFASKIIQSTPHLLSSSIDDKIPFNVWFIIPYCIWYLLLFIVPYYYYEKDKNTLCKYIVSYALCVILAAIVFSVYPTTLIRPELENTNILNMITNLIYYIDTPALNCLPSLHCAISMLFILSSFTSKKVTKDFRYVVSFFGVLIMIATLFVKQHVLIDLVAGDILMTITYIFATYNKKTVNKVKKLLSI